MKFKIVDEGFSSQSLQTALAISIQVADNGYIIQIVDIEGQQKLEVFTKEQSFEMLQSIVKPLGLHLSNERVEQ